MAFDISVDESPTTELLPESFEEFYSTCADLLVTVLHMACGDPTMANAAVAAVLTRTSQRWTRVARHHNLVGWAIHAGIEHADKKGRDHALTQATQAAGGYERGLPLDVAFARLPLQQRAALVTAYYLGWSDDVAAAGFEIPVSTVQTRRERALSFIAHHQQRDDDVIPPLRSHLRGLSEQEYPAPPDLRTVRRRARGRTAGTRIAAGLAAGVLIVIGAALFQAPDKAPIADTPAVVEGPSTSAKWFGPISDDQGGFVALNTSGASRFIGSDDGTEWLALTTWNSRAIDLRADVSSFERTGGRYVAVIETPSRYGTYVPPFIATSIGLRDWNVRQIEIGEPPAVEGLFGRFDVVATAASGDHVLVALAGKDELDYRHFGISSDDVCVESATLSLRAYILCNGETITVATPEGDRFAETRYFRATGSGPFLEVNLPDGVDARSLVGIAAGFAVAHAELGHVLVSADGEQWRRVPISETPNRFLLIAGWGSASASASTDAGAAAGALVIEPDVTGWRSHVVSISGRYTTGSLPLEIEPAAVWSQPELASGPAGWAMFVTTSRPWERTESTSGWAVDTGEWIVSRLPDTDTITAQSIATSTTLRFTSTSEWVKLNGDGSVELVDPQTDATLVEVTQQDIEQARSIAFDEAQVRAQVFFSPNGIDWRSVWSSTSDAWSGSLAVGDDELLLSGTRLTGGPITIALDS